MRGIVAVVAATTALGRLLDIGPSSYLGWTIPVDPALLSLHGEPAFTSVLARHQIVSDG